MSDQVVVTVAECNAFLPGPAMADVWCERFAELGLGCLGCLGGQRRAVRGTAIPVRSSIAGRNVGRRVWIEDEL